MAIAIVAFAIQGFITSRIVQRFQLKNTFLVQPFVAFGSTLAMILSPEVVSATVSSLILKIGRNTIDESTRKAFQGFIPEERRGRVALFTDNYAPAVGMVFSALATLGIIYLCQQYKIPNPFYIYLGLSLLCAAIAIAAYLRMRKVYDSSLFNWRLKRRKRGGDVLSKLEF
jgi:MFS family permease